MYQLEKLNIQSRGCLFPQQQVNVAAFGAMLCTFLGKLLTKPYQQRQTADGNKCAKRHFILQEEFNTRHQQKRSRAGSLTSTDLSQLLASVGLKKKKNQTYSSCDSYPTVRGFRCSPSMYLSQQVQYQVHHRKTAEVLSLMRGLLFRKEEFVQIQSSTLKSKLRGA